MNWLRDKMLAYVGLKLNGKKTYIAGTGFLLMGIIGVIGKIYPDSGMPDSDWDTIGGFFSGGMAAFGLGHKIEKITP